MVITKLSEYFDLFVIAVQRMPPLRSKIKWIIDSSNHVADVN